MTKLLLLLGMLLTAEAYSKSVTLNKERTVEVIGVVDTEIINQASKLLELVPESEGTRKPVWLLVNSPGGMVDPGLIFINAMEIAKKRGYKLKCAVGVLAASMAFQILAHCNKIYSLPNAKLLFHPVRIGGTFTKEQLEYYLNSIKDIEDKMNTRLLRYFKFNEEMFYYNYHYETMWEANRLAEETRKIIIVDDIKGTKKLFKYQRPRFFFFMTTGIKYIMPNVNEDSFYIKPTRK